MKKEKRIKGIITLPAKFWDAIDNRIDNILVNSRGDAIVSLLLELQDARPSAINFNSPTGNSQKEVNGVIENKTNIISNNIKGLKDFTSSRMCKCGHPAEHHDDTGCLGNGGMCVCHQFTPA